MTDSDYQHPDNPEIPVTPQPDSGPEEARSEGVETKGAETKDAKSENVETVEIAQNLLIDQDAILAKLAGPLGGFVRDAETLFAMIRDLRDGRYRELPWASITAGVMALAYIVSPLDLLPDFLPGLGQLDDALVLAFAFAVLRQDLEDYRAWQDDQAREVGAVATETPS